MLSQDVGGIRIKQEKKEVFSPKRAVNGVTVWKSENPQRSDSHVALYKIKDNGKVILACVEPDKVEEALQSLEYFKYADVQDLVSKKISIDEYAKKIGFEGDVLPVLPEVEEVEEKKDKRKGKRG